MLLLLLLWSNTTHSELGFTGTATIAREEGEDCALLSIHAMTRDESIIASNWKQGKDMRGRDEGNDWQFVHANRSLARSSNTGTTICLLPLLSSSLFIARNSCYDPITTYQTCYCGAEKKDSFLRENKCSKSEAVADIYRGVRVAGRVERETR